MKSKLLSRKFLLALATIVFVIITQMLNIQIDESAYYTIVGALVSYIVGESVVDATKKKQEDNLGE